MEKPILVIGGGIGGLTTAIALRARDLPVEVYESAPELRPVGAGIWVPTNAMQVLERLGLADAVAAAGVALERIEIRSDSGPLLQEIDLHAVRATFGQTTIAILRADLQRILRDRLPPDTVRLGCACTGYTRGRGGLVTARFAGGAAEAHGHPLIGADGIRSAIRRQMHPEVELRYSGQTCYRGLAAMTLETDLQRVSREIWGSGRRFGFSAVAEGTVYWYATIDAPAGGADVPGSAPETLQEEFGAFPEPVADILAATEPASILRTDLSDLPPLREWSEENVTLLGDAAHAMTPNLGQGGAQAIEDAWVLADCLSRRTEDFIPESLREYERKRRARTARLADLAWRIGKMAHLRGRISRTVRDYVLSRTPERLYREQIESLYRLNF